MDLIGLCVLLAISEARTFHPSRKIEVDIPRLRICTNFPPSESSTPQNLSRCWEESLTFRLYLCLVEPSRTKRKLESILIILVPSPEKRIEKSVYDSPSPGGAPSLRPGRFRFANNRNVLLEAGDRMNRSDWSASSTPFLIINLNGFTAYVGKQLRVIFPCRRLDAVAKHSMWSTSRRMLIKFTVSVLWSFDFKAYLFTNAPIQIQLFHECLIE